MGEIPTFTKEQKIILDLVRNDQFLTSSFYFTGGTALSSIYLHHRFSEDLDFFSEEKFDEQTVVEKLSDWAKEKSFDFSPILNERVKIFSLTFEHKAILKVDFGYYPYQRIEKPTWLGELQVDSLLDIAVNKLLTVNQRTEIKDFVDLYFLLKEFSLWDLVEGVRVKFRVKLEPIIIASDFLKVSEFSTLPKMILPLKLVELKDFYIEKARELGSEAVE